MCTYFRRVVREKSLSKVIATAKIWHFALFLGIFAFFPGPSFAFVFPPNMVESVIRMF